MSEVRIATLDTNELIDLLDAPCFRAQRVARTFLERGFGLIVPEIPLTQTLAHSREERCYRRFCNLAELITCIGYDAASIGAPLHVSIAAELSGCNSRFPPVCTPEHQEAVFSNGDSFGSFLPYLHRIQADSLTWLDAEGWLARDNEAYGLMAEAIPNWNAHPLRARTAQRHLPLIPKGLSVDHLALRCLAPDLEQRRRVVASPDAHPALVLLTLATDLSVLAAVTNLRGDNRLDHLRIEKDSWIDARILAASVRADVLLTNDARLARRAEHIRQWGFQVPHLISRRAFFGKA